MLRKIMLNITSLLLNLGRKSDQCKPPARFLLGRTTAFETRISWLQAFLVPESPLPPA